MRYILVFILLFINIVYAKELQKVSIQLLWKHQFEFAGYYIAKEKGFYEDAGLDVEIKEYKNGSITNDVLRGKSTFGISYSNVVLEKANHKDIVLLLASLQSSPHVLVSLESSGIKSIKEFKNKQIMINKNATKTASFLAMLRANDIKLNDMDIYKHTFNINDLIDKKIDITSCFLSNEPYILEKKHIKYKIWDPKDYGFDFYDDILFTSKNIVKNNPDMVQKFKEASIKGWLYAYNHIDEAIDIILKKYNSQNKTKDALLYEANILKKLALQYNTQFGNIDKQKIRRILDIYKLLGFTKNDIDIDKFIFDSDKLYLSKKEKEFIKNTTITVAASKTWQPFTFVNEFGKLDGISADYWKHLVKMIKLNVKYKFYDDFTKELNDIKDKKADIIFSTGKTPDREKYAIFTKEYIKFPISIATRTSHTPNLNKILHYKIAVGKNFTAHKLLKQRYPNMKFVFIKNLKEGLKKLSNKEVDGVADIRPSLVYNIHKLGYKNLTVDLNTNIMFALRIMIRDDYKPLLSILNKAISLTKDKEIETIIEKWENIKFAYKIDYNFIFKITLILLLILAIFFYRQYLLKKSLKEFDELINATLEGIIIFKNGVCIDTNQSAIDIFGYKNKKDLIGKNALEFIAEESREKVKEKLALDNTKPYEAIMKKADGKGFYALIRGYNLKSKGIRLSSVIDISILKQQELALIEQSKLAAMGEMIGNIAHQWRQPLSIISTASTGILAQKEYGLLTDEILKTSCEAITNNAQYLSRTIDDFRNFIKGERTKTKFNIKEHLESFLHLVEGTIKTHKLNVIINIQEDIEIYGYDNELTQCYINIFNNAKDALKEIEEQNRVILIEAYQTTDTITISIKDSAGGIKQNIINKIFDPYFTTKHQSQGTGLGLYMTHKLITTGMNGTIKALNEEFKVDDKVYYGAAFYITLPIK